MEENINQNPLSQLTAYHKQLLEQFKDANPEDISLSDDAKALIAFNGYYALQNVADSGAFFAIDTNIIYILLDPGMNPMIVYVVDLIISLSQNEPTQRYTFTENNLSHFDGKHLMFNQDSVVIDLLFKHTNTPSSDGYSQTAELEGTVKLHKGSPPIKVMGSTYNNPIPVSLYAGTYRMPKPKQATSFSSLTDFIKQKVGLSQAVVEHVNVLSIDEQSELYYDYGKNNGELQRVWWYAYNMNMFYFTILDCMLKGLAVVPSLIMGTAAEGGLACNDMTLSIIPPKLTTRSLQTVQKETKRNLEEANQNSAELAAFSGYYPLASIHSKAFISIESLYLTTKGFQVKIAVSLNGEESRGCYFEADGMTFRNNTLTIPQDYIEVTFNRKYGPADGSLVSITGTIHRQPINSFTLFNPVPLTAFGGSPMFDIFRETSLIIENDETVVYKNLSISDFLYVPVMYILASPSEAQEPTLVMSFGTNGIYGNTCIVFEKGSSTNVLSAKPFGI